MLWPLVQTAHLARRRFEAVFDEEDLTGPQFGVLAALADGDDLSSTDLARALLVRPQSMATLTDALVEAGLVERRGPRGRGRRAALSLTDRGASVLERLRPAVAALAGPDVTGLDATEEAELRRLLAKAQARLAAAEAER